MCQLTPILSVTQNIPTKTLKPPEVISYTNQRAYCISYPEVICTFYMNSSSFILCNPYFTHLYEAVKLLNICRVFGRQCSRTSSVDLSVFCLALCLQLHHARMQCTVVKSNTQPEETRFQCLRVLFESTNAADHNVRLSSAVIQ